MTLAQQTVREGLEVWVVDGKETITKDVLRSSLSE